LIVIQLHIRENATEIAVRQRDDIQKVTFVLKDTVNIKSTINNAIRRGKKIPDKPRLLKITIGSTEEKVTIAKKN